MLGIELDINGKENYKGAAPNGEGSSTCLIINKKKYIGTKSFKLYFGGLEKGSCENIKWCDDIYKEQKLTIRIKEIIENSKLSEPNRDKINQDMLHEYNALKQELEAKRLL